MIFEDEENTEEKLSHKRYKEYKKEMEDEKKPNENIIIFISVFFVMLLLFLALAKYLSPDVDVNISNTETQTEQTSETDKGNIDERLKDLQMENKTGKTDETFSNELEEKVVLPTKQPKVIGEDKLEANTKDKDNEEKPKTEQKPAAQPNKEVTQTKSEKVVVGYYTTLEQAEVAKEIIEDSGLNYHPFVKKIGNAYTLQVGSFSTKEKAQSVMNELLRNNFPARILTD